MKKVLILLLLSSLFTGIGFASKDYELEFAKKQTSGISDSIVKDVWSGVISIQNNANEYFCNLAFKNPSKPDERYTDACIDWAWDERTLVWEKQILKQYLISLKDYIQNNKPSKEIQKYISDQITLEYYYGMIATKQFDTAQKLQWGKNIKTRERYKDNYWNIQWIVINLPENALREQKPDDQKEFDKINKNFKAKYTYLWKNTYQFPVIVLEKAKNNKTLYTVYSVTKKIENGKIISGWSKKVWAFTTRYVPCQWCKPVIYFYPTTTTDITVKLDLQANFSITYPQIDDNNTRSITAQPDWNLTDKKDGKEYSYIFREANKMKLWQIDEWFVVKKENYVTFLQEKLAYLGLTPKEYNEFIVYRLPLMKQYPYVALKFAGKEYTDQAPLTITPTPDSIQRVFIVFKGLEKSIDLPQQKITPFKRSWFSVIERWGTEIYN